MNSIVYRWRFRAHKVANRINGLDGANELNCNSYQTLLTHVTHVTHTSLFAEYITHIAMKTRQFLVRRGVAVLHHKRRTPRDSTLTYSPWGNNTPYSGRPHTLSEWCRCGADMRKPRMGSTWRTSHSGFWLKRRRCAAITRCNFEMNLSSEWCGSVTS